MSTEVWFRNPDLYIREIVEVGVERIAIDRGYAVKRRIDPVRFATLYYPKTTDFRILMVGDQGTAEYRRGDALDKPTGVYPTWDYTAEDLTVLEELMAKPVGHDPAICADDSVPPDERPVLGQEHRVVVIRLPIASSGPGRRVLHQLSDLQRDYPDCILHIHGLYGFRPAFSNGFGAVDIEARTTAAKGKVILPNGKELRHEMTAKVPDWVTLLGMSPVDLEQPRNRCMYIIRSALWAGENFTKDLKFRVKGGVTVDPDAATPTAATVAHYRSGTSVVKPGDKFACDSCSLADTCKYYREGSVCTVPDAESSELVRMFRTRDAERIIDGLNSVLAKQAERLERGVEEEEEFNELSPEVTKIINSLMTHGVKLAKLINPALNGGPKVGVFVAGGHAAGSTNPKAAIAGVVAELEAQGIPRERITEEMIIRVLSGGPSKEIVASVATEVRAG